MAKYEFKTKTVTVGPRKSEPVEQEAFTDPFSSQPLQAFACLQSWRVTFSNAGRPWHEGFVEVVKTTVQSDNTVQLSYLCGVRDHSHYFDDSYTITATFLIIAEIADN